MKIIVCDFDGTICELAFQMYENNIIPLEEKIRVMKQVRPMLMAREVFLRLRLEWRKEYKLVIITGRSEDCRKVSEEWLRRYNFRYDDLIMMEKSWETFEEYIQWKLEEIRELNPVMVIDDSDKFFERLMDVILENNLMIAIHGIMNEDSWNYENIMRKINIVNKYRE